MKKHSENKIKEIIKKGFDLDLISIEFDVPIETLIRYKEEIEESKTNEKHEESKESIQNKTDNYEKTPKHELESKMEALRKRYYQLYNEKRDENKFQTANIQMLSPEENEIINHAIEKCRKLYNDISNIGDSKEKAESIKKIIFEINKIKEYQLTIEQAEELNQFLTYDTLGSVGNRLKSNYKTTKNYVTKRLVEAINIKQEQTDNVEELKMLKRKITKEVEQDNYIRVTIVKNKIQEKIGQLTKKDSMQEQEEKIPEDLQRIVDDLSKGKLNIEEANNVIEEEAKKRTRKTEKNKFGLSEEQYKRQVLNQIRINLTENGEIVNPDETIMQLRKLFGEGLYEAVRIVTKNFIIKKDYEKAKEICERKYIEDKQDTYYKNVKFIKRQIRNAELGDFIVKGIKRKASIEEDDEYYNLIEKGIKEGNVRLRDIPLGKSKDGTRNINLDDIWEKEKIR